jgi:hypothetical protein
MTNMRKAFLVSLVPALALSLAGCSHTTTPIGREYSARPRVEQIAFSAALESAYKKINMSFCKDKKVFVETKALSEKDIGYINSYVSKLVIAAGGTVVTTESAADIKMSNFFEVTGTDEVKRSMRKDVVVAQVTGTLTLTDVAAGKVIQIMDLKGAAQTKRNKDADTKILE